MISMLFQRQKAWFSVFKIKTLKIADLMPAENAFVQRNRSLNEQYLKSYTDGPISASILCTKASKNMLNSDVFFSNFSYNCVSYEIIFAITAKRKHFLHKLHSRKIKTVMLGT